MQARFADLPGADLVDGGVRELAAGRRSLEALPVSRATVRVRSCGVPVGELSPDVGRELDRLLGQRDGAGAHSADNALTRRRVSCVQAAEHHAARGFAPGAAARP